MKKIFITLAILLSIGLPLSASHAFEVKTDNSIKLAKDEIADGNVYASCSDMTIDGTVNGDIIALCKNITINGLINGDIIAFGDKIEINGSIKGNARIAGSKININGSIDRNANVFANEINFGKDSIIKWDALVGGVNGNFDGNVDGNLHGFMSLAKISGKIGKNVNLTIDGRSNNNQGGLLVSKDAIIAGDLSYTASKDVQLESSSSVSGKIQKNEARQKETNPLAIFWNIFYKATSLILIAIIAISFKKDIIKQTTSKLDKNWLYSLLIGFSLLLFTPIVIVILMLTVVGIPLALILLASYLSMIILSIIIASSYLGSLLIKSLSKKEANPYLSAIIGLLIFSLTSSTPFIGWLISVLIISLGFGALFKKITDKKND